VGKPQIPANPDPLAPQRSALAAALTALHTEEARRDALQNALDKNQADRWAASSAEADIAAKLREIERDEPARLAWQAASGVDALSTSPVIDARRELEKAQAEERRLAELQAALDVELAGIDRRLGRANDAVKQALGQLVLASPQLQNLLAAQAACWSRLRGLRRALYDVAHTLGTGVPSAVVDLWLQQISLNPESVATSAGPIVTDAAPAARWNASLADLLKEPLTASLPGKV
jgi:hypothetical protein